MTKVFIGGSRKMARLNEVIRKRADNIIDKGFWALIGDANGADKAMQKHFAESHYQNVIVFCSGNRCRNNIGNWETRNIQVPSSVKGFDFYTVKDKAMSDEADYGFMLWDGISNGTLNNILNLVERDKKVVVYFSLTKGFIDLRTLNDVQSLIAKCPPGVVKNFERKLHLKDRLELSHPKLKFA
ncbi:MAG: hypothetical protein V3T30_07065 [Thermodesulfobacteriota bacterium]